MTHLLLIDTETVATVRELVRNAADLYRRFCDIAGCSTYLSYTLVLVFPNSRADLAVPAGDLATEMKQSGVPFHVHAVSDDEMSLVGKAGLLACSLWAIVGATLVNDAPIPPVEAGSLLSLANRPYGVYPIGGGRHAALICNQTAIGPSLLTLREDHDLTDVMAALGAEVDLQPAGRTRKRRWWQIWAK